MPTLEEWVKDYKPDPALMDPVVREMHGQNDRGAAIAGTVYLGEHLQNAIANQWPPMSKTARSRIFEGYGPLSTLRAQIDIAGAMGVLNIQARADFHRIRRIRNLAAHIGLPFSFEDKQPLALIGELHCMKHMPPDEEPVSPARNLFTGAIKMLLGYLFFQEHWKKRFGHSAVMPDFSSNFRQSRDTNSSSDSNRGS